MLPARIFFYAKFSYPRVILAEGSLRHNKILLAGPGVRAPGPYADVAASNAAGNPAPTAPGSIPYFLTFFKHFKKYGCAICYAGCSVRGRKAASHNHLTILWSAQGSGKCPARRFIVARFTGRRLLGPLLNGGGWRILRGRGHLCQRRLRHYLTYGGLHGLCGGLLCRCGVLCGCC